MIIITLFIRLEIHCFDHYKVMPVNLGICNSFFLPFLLLLLPLALLVLCPFNTVPYLMVGQQDILQPWERANVNGYFEKQSLLKQNTWSITSFGFSASFLSLVSKPLGGIRI